MRARLARLKASWTCEKPCGHLFGPISLLFTQTNSTVLVGGGCIEWDFEDEVQDLGAWRGKGQVGKAAEHRLSRRHHTCLVQRASAL